MTRRELSKKEIIAELQTNDDYLYLTDELSTQLREAGISNDTNIEAIISGMQDSIHESDADMCEQMIINRFFISCATCKLCNTLCKNGQYTISGKQISISNFNAKAIVSRYPTIEVESIESNSLKEHGTLHVTFKYSTNEQSALRRNIPFEKQIIEIYCWSADGLNSYSTDVEIGSLNIKTVLDAINKCI